MISMHIKVLSTKLSAWLLLFLLLPGGEASAQMLRVGDVAPDFSFTARKPFVRPDGVQVPAGASVRLSDFAGSIVFLEWFAVWCPFCIAAVPQVEEGVVRHYSGRAGNPQGVPVVHIAVNQESRSFFQAQTDSFVQQSGFGITLNDYDSTGTNKVRFLFQSTGQPIFVAINGLTNSVSHKPWEVLVNHLGYGERDFLQELASFRNSLDSVKPASISIPLVLGFPKPLPNGGLEFRVEGPSGVSCEVEASSDLKTWIRLETISLTGGSQTVMDQTSSREARYYRAITR